MSRISVVIPCYNRADIVSRAIQSAKAQTVAPYEIIVVDDGSKDGSAEVAKRFGGNVIVIEQENKGAAAARNRGIQYALGEWIAFLDSDDEWHPNKLELQIAAASQFPMAQLIFCDTIVRSEHEIVIPSRFGLGGLYGSEIARNGDFYLYDRTLFARMLTQSRVISSAVMVRRRLPELMFPPDIWGAEDWALWLNLCLHHCFASVDQLLVTMHRQGDNISSKKARLYRNDLLVLDRLACQNCLSDHERALISQEIRERRFGAAYFSLLAGDGKEARSLLKEIPLSRIGISRYITYRVFSFIPRKIVSELLRFCSKNNNE
jgi:glycosyltransferase involved in cell wall biosynthesis